MLFTKDAVDGLRDGTHWRDWDRSKSCGPWTHRTLSLIALHPGVVSTMLAGAVNQERPTFKLNVRKLKNLGLTESLEVGYQLTPLGISFRAALDQCSG